MRQPALLFILKGEMDWHRNGRQAPWKLSSADANRAMHVSRITISWKRASTIGTDESFELYLKLLPQWFATTKRQASEIPNFREISGGKPDFDSPQERKWAFLERLIRQSDSLTLAGSTISRPNAEISSRKKFRYEERRLYGGGWSLLRTALRPNSLLTGKNTANNSSFCSQSRLENLFIDLNLREFLHVLFDSDDLPIRENIIGYQGISSP